MDITGELKLLGWPARIGDFRVSFPLAPFEVEVRTVVVLAELAHIVNRQLYNAIRIIIITTQP